MSSEKWFYWFERNPTPEFITAIRRVFPGFEDADAWWDKLGKTIEFRAGKTLDEVRGMRPQDVEVALDVFWPVESAADQQDTALQSGNASSKKKRKPPGKSRGRGGHNRKNITAYIFQIAELRAARDGADPRAAVVEVGSLGDTELAELINRELAFDEPVSSKAIYRWRKKRIATPSTSDSTADAEQNARQDEARTTLRTCTRIDGRTVQDEEPSQKSSRRHLRRAADQILEQAGCRMPLN